MKSRRKEIISYFKQMDRSFFMDTNKDLAPFDQALPIGFEQTISQPSLVLEMTLALDLQPEHSGKTQWQSGVVEPCISRAVLLH